MKAGIDFIGIGCGALIINDKSQVLLVKRSMSAKTEPGMWARPGGEVEFGESGKDAVEREILEETGIVVKITKPLEFTEVISPDKKTHWVALGYLAEYISGIPENKEPRKHDDIRWFPLDRLPNNLTHYTKNSIKVYLQIKDTNYEREQVYK